MNLTTNTKSFSVEKGTAGSDKSGTKVIKQVFSGGSSSGNQTSIDVFVGATDYNAGRQGLVPQPLAGQQTMFLKGNGLWDQVFKYIREDEDGNIYIDGKATKFGSPVYLDDIFSNKQDLEEAKRIIEIHDNVKLDKNQEISGDVSIGGGTDFLGEARFSNNVIFNRNNPNDSTINKVTVNADLEVNGKSNFTDDMTATNITVDYLTVTKLAHFFELVIDKIRASQGQVIITDANAKVDYVEKVNSQTKLYWRADSENEENLSLNEFVEGDQIICQTFNRGQMTKNDDGSYHGFNVSNKYYWVVCSEVGQGVEMTVNGEKHVYNYVAIDDSDDISPKDGAFLPEVGDEIVQLGNRKDTLRQAAIIISAYNNAYIDKEIKAPAIVQYDGIDDFSLEKHRLNVISKGLNKFTGSYLTKDGKTDIVDKIGDIETTTTNKFSEIQQTIDGINTTVSNQQQSIDTISGKVSENTTNISKLSQKADEISASVSKNSSMISQISTSVDGDLSDIRQQVQTNTSNIASLTIKADNINSTVEQHTEQIKTISRNLDTIDSSISSMETTITNNKSEIDQKADQIVANVSSNITKIDDLTGKVTQNTTDIANLKIKSDEISSTVTRIDGDYVTSSQLTQKADSILAEVSNTYIKIEDGKVIINAAVDEKVGDWSDEIDSIKKGNIELNGNTTINGNLTIQNATDGLTLVGDGGTTDIRSKDIGQFWDYIKTPTYYFQMVQSGQVGMTTSQYGNDFKETFVNDNNDAKQTISIPANTTVTWNSTDYVFDNQMRYYMGFTPIVTMETTGSQRRWKVQTPDQKTTFIQFIVKSVSYIWSFIDMEHNGALLHSATDVTSGSFEVGSTAVPQCKVRIMVYVTIDKWETWKTSFTYNNKTYTLNSDSKDSLLDWAVPIAYTSITLSSKDPNINNLIGYNGQAYNFGEGNGVFIGSTGLQAKYGDYSFMINPKSLAYSQSGSYTQTFPAGIWAINKDYFTNKTGPFNTFETATSEYLTAGRSFGSKNVRVVTGSGKILVSKDDDLIIVTDYLHYTTKLQVDIYFPPCNGSDFIGHEIKIMHIQPNKSDVSSTVTVYTKDSFYPLYNQSGNYYTSTNLTYEVATFIPNFCMGCWVKC